MKFRYISILTNLYGLTMKRKVEKLYTSRSIKKEKKDKE